jgi:hypothetical protein
MFSYAPPICMRVMQVIAYIEIVPMLAANNFRSSATIYCSSKVQEGYLRACLKSFGQSG